MREIKFRAWDKRMLDVMGLELYENIPSVVMLATGPKGIPRRFEDVKLMQFTGLKDAKNREIHEGDIVEFEDKNWQVDFEDGHYYLTWESGTELKTRFLEIAFSNQYEIIGNIYENKELLKDGK